MTKQNQNPGQQNQNPGQKPGQQQGGGQKPGEQQEAAMSTNWRISSFNGALLAAYFIPTWTMVAFNIMVSPIHALYERPNIAVGLFISDHLQMTAITTIRVAWLLALGKLTVVAFFVLFLSLIFP